MGLFGSLYTSASGMISASRGTQGVSENVANMTTVGYKRSDTAFADLIAGNRSTTKNAKTGGVGTTKITRTTQQGQIQQTGSSLDASISGNGFFAVSRTLDGSSFAYTRNGQFGEYAVRTTPDAQDLVTENAGEQTFLRNSAGFFLYGWPIDVNGSVASGADTTSLVPIEISNFQQLSLATTQISLSVNLDSTEENFNPQRLGQTLPVDNQAIQFSRSVTVYDDNGDEHPITFQYRKITGPMAQFTSNTGLDLDVTEALVDPLGPTPAILAGDTLDLSNGTDTLSVTFVSGNADTTLGEAATLTDMIKVINGYTGSGTTPLFNATIDSNGQLLVRSADPSATLDISSSSASVLGSTGFNIIADPVDGYTYNPDYDIVAGTGAYATNQADFPAFENTTDPNVFGWWEVTVLIPDPADPDSGNLVTQSQGLLNFDGDGSLNAVDGAEVMTLNAIDFDSGATGDELSLTVDMGKTSQFAGNYNVLDASQNGAALGDRTNVYISDHGTVRVRFSNGAEIDVYQIPVAMFANPEGLNAESGTVFTETGTSGGVTLNAAKESGAGTIVSSTLENSNVDLGNEMSYLIIFQRTFGLNSQVINAIDEMTQNLSQLKR